jgi:hypothetical protein
MSRIILACSEARDRALLARSNTAATLPKQITPPAPLLPLLVKISPDLSREEKECIARLLLSLHSQGKIDGMIVSNTTTSRPASLLSTEAAKETGTPPSLLSTSRMVKLIFCQVDSVERLSRTSPLVSLGRCLFSQRARYVSLLRFSSASLRFNWLPLLHLLDSYHWSGRSCDWSGCLREDRRRCLLGADVYHACLRGTRSCEEVRLFSHCPPHLS